MAERIDVDATVFVAVVRPATWSLVIPSLGIAVEIGDGDDVVEVAEDLVGQRLGVPSGRVQIDVRPPER